MRLGCKPPQRNPKGVKVGRGSDVPHAGTGGLGEGSGGPSAFVRSRALGLPNRALAANAQGESGGAESSDVGDGILRLKKWRDYDLRSQALIIDIQGIL